MPLHELLTQIQALSFIAQSLFAVFQYEVLFLVTFKHSLDAYINFEHG
jgi:hypothetical protein